jgi:hypothetical protein
VRLRRGFVNVERAPFGGEKLRIPTLLLEEKMRTQTRFNVRSPLGYTRVVLRVTGRPCIKICVARGVSWQSMRVDAGPDEEVVVKGGVGKKVMHNASTKVAVVVERMLLPLLETPLRSHVTFVPVDEQAEFDLMEEVERRRPDVMGDPVAFTGHFQSLYERYMYYTHGYAVVRA